MTIVNKPKSSKSKKSSSRRSDKSMKPRTKKMTSRTASLGRVPPTEDPNKVSVDKGPGGHIYCRSSQKSKPFAQRDLGKCLLSSLLFVKNKTKLEADFSVKNGTAADEEFSHRLQFCASPKAAAGIGVAELEFIYLQFICKVFFIYVKSNKGSFS